MEIVINIPTNKQIEEMSKEQYESIRAYAKTVIDNTSKDIQIKTSGEASTMHHFTTIKWVKKGPEGFHPLINYRIDPDIDKDEKLKNIGAVPPVHLVVGEYYKVARHFYINEKEYDNLIIKITSVKNLKGVGGYPNPYKLVDAKTIYQYEIYGRKHGFIGDFEENTVLHHSLRLLTQEEKRELGIDKKEPVELKPDELYKVESGLYEGCVIKITGFKGRYQFGNFISEYEFEIISKRNDFTGTRMFCKNSAIHKSLRLLTEEEKKEFQTSKKDLSFYFDTQNNRDISAVFQQVAFEEGYEWRHIGKKLIPDAGRYILFGHNKNEEKYYLFCESPIDSDLPIKTLAEAIIFFRTNPNTKEEDKFVASKSFNAQARDELLDADKKIIDGLLGKLKEAEEKKNFLKNLNKELNASRDEAWKENELLRHQFEEAEKTIAYWHNEWGILSRNKQFLKQKLAECEQELKDRDQKIKELGKENAGLKQTITSPMGKIILAVEHKELTDKFRELEAKYNELANLFDTYGLQK